jgi:hypothetical protein
MIDEHPYRFLDLMDHPGLLLLMAGVCLVAALRFTRHALRPIGVIIQSAAAAAVVVFAVGIAIALVLAFAVM